MQIKMRMSELKDRYAGRPAAVLGGGPSLPRDMALLPIGCVLIAVNHHALQVCKPDFMVYNDHPDPADAPELMEAIQSTTAIRVSSEPSSDVVFDVEVWTGFYSSQTAAWLALWLGCEPVILCGMDLYQGERTYFHDYEDRPHFHYPLEHHLNPWVEEAKNKLPGWQRVRAMSGPLVGLFGRYDADQPNHEREVWRPSSLPLFQEQRGEGES